ncbi:HAD family hydrolase [Promicromonospora sp. CA-289599]|uniref:HAD family hydrolase n=1 Tax=Promicromonospora sp. CA-289599 TaxID=3240014 RepID=UPI003D8B7A58
MITADTTPTAVDHGSPLTGVRMLVASDIDGTLLVTGRPPSSAVIESVAAVRDAGHHPVLSTGRSLSGALAAARELGLANGWVIASNGAVTARLIGGAYVLSQVRTVDAETVVRLATKSLPGARIAVEIVGVGYHVNKQFPARELNGDQVKVSRLSDLWAGSTPRVVLSGPDAQRLVPALRAAGMTAIATRPDWVDVTVGGVSKATAVERLRQDLGIPIECTVAIGDGENDIELLQWAWRGVAMGHAAAQVQDAADEVADSIEQEGAVRVLQSLLTTGSAPDPRQKVDVEVFQP